jgi:hypothetical protein
MARRRPPRPRDPSQLGKLIVDLSVGAAKDETPDAMPDTPSIAFARLGGQRGGAARAATLSGKERQRIAKKAAQARWHGKHAKPRERQ